MRLNLFRYLTALACIPILFIILFIVSRSWQGPYYQAFFSDPSYAYLMNSLNIFNGEIPGHTDHPGTTVQELGGFVLKIDSIFKDEQDKRANTTSKVLENPEAYIHIISYVLLSIVVTTIFLFGLQVYLATRHLGLAIISQMFPLTFSSLITHLPRLEPEPLLVGITYLLAAALVPVVDAGNREFSLLRTFIVGIIMGFGVVTKVTFAPLLIFLFVIPGHKKKIFAIIALLSTVCILTIPIWSRLHRVMNWLTEIMIHSGHYGSGEKGLPSLHTLFDNTIDLIIVTPLLFLFILLFLILFYASKTNRITSNLDWVRTISLLVIVCSIVITIKHYSVHYLMPVIALSGFLIFLSIMSFPKEKRDILVSIIFILGITLIYTATSKTKENLFTANKRHDSLAQLSKEAQKYGCRIINYYSSSSQEYALQFGNDFARKIYFKELQQLYPHHISYNIWNNKFENFRGPISDRELDDILHDTHSICLIGTVALQSWAQPKVKILAEMEQDKLYKFIGFK